MVDLLLRNACVEDEIVDLAVQDGLIIDHGQLCDGEADEEIDLEGCLVVPGFIDSHLHLDIALMNDFERPGRPEPYRSFRGLIKDMERRKLAFTQADIEERASRAIEMAVRNGTTAIRAQCHVDTEIGLKHLEALLNVRQKYTEQLTLQIVAFPSHGLFYRDPNTIDLFREAFRAGADIMGGSAGHDGPAAKEGVDYQKKHFDIALDLAMELDVDLDVHADLLLPDETALENLDITYLARRVIDCGYQGRVTAGHVSALDSLKPEEAQKVIELIHAAQINVVSLPDLYRLGREDTWKVRRGLTRVKELLAAGVNVTLASNNVRDALRPLGNFDLLEEALILAYGAHMDSVDQLETLMKMCTVNAARALRLENYGLRPGCRADFVVLDAVTPSGAIVGQVDKKYVFKHGQRVAGIER